MKNLSLSLFGFVLIQSPFFFSSYSQVKYPKTVTYNTTNILNSVSFFLNKLNTTPDFITDLNLKFNEKDLKGFSLYNIHTKLNDIYSCSNDSFYYEKSVTVNSNLYNHVDSFNPNGASNFGVALIIGSLNTILRVFSK